ncbi:hypothetical protein N7462_008503 [Penicillium macrosclerotiorum]|uniref:uncharacterized protein n=1 Tax=Penicillium macrosclerotiorum TaxID=303699 RepID=UPI002548ACCF|nr:uncharacterized protein N7462_008503 [Penicillium macrosclerotiorum]KAJ5675606.1 hypothetical protein N7462_008503 [Penicillium macrosclerotiorum]
MAEKRKLPPRGGREPAAKRRVSEAATPQSQKKKAPTPRVPSPPPPPPEPVEAPLPISIKDGEPVPVTRERQPGDLSDKEYQSFAESAVLLLSLERSKKKWLSDGILVRYYTKPKKTKREQIEKNNPPKDSMTRIGPCDITVGPHLFDAMIYTVKDPNAPNAIQYAPPQRPMVHYGHPNNFQQYQPYPSQQKRPPYTHGPPGGRPPHAYPGSHPPPQQRPSQPQPGHRPQPQPGQSGQPAKPSPDPVIQMLATRAAADPELKALMRVVASSQASQEQLRAFQAHIDELNAIIKAREQEQQRQRNAAATPSQPQPPSQTATPAHQNKSTPPQPTPQQKSVPETKPTPHNQAATPQSSTQSQTQSKEPQQQPASTGLDVTPAPAPVPAAAKPPGEAAQSASQPPAPATPVQTETPAAAASASQGPSLPPAIKQEPGTTGSTNQQAMPSQPPQTTTPAIPATPSATTGPPAVPPPSSVTQQQAPAIQSPQPPNKPQMAAPRPGQPQTPYQQGPYSAQPPLQSRPSQYDSPTPYYRPQPAPSRPLPTPINYKSVVFEFTSPLTPYGSSTSGHAGSGDRYLFPEHSILEWIPNENTILASFLIVRKVDPNAPFPIEVPSENSTSRKGKSASKSKKGAKAEKGKDGTETPAPAETPQQQGSADQSESKPKTEQEAPGTPAKEANLKEYWQPVTFRIHAGSPRILEPLTRVVKPADEVRKYMNEIMDRAERAPDGFPALRLPHEEAQEAFESESTPFSGINGPAAIRNRASRAIPKPSDEESEVENSVDVEEEELMDFYDAPMSMPPLRV